MKFSVNQTFEVDETERITLADVLDGKQSKRQATRNEFKDFAWAHGESWRNAMMDLYDEKFGTGEGSEEEDDLLGTGSPDDDDGDLLGTAGTEHGAEEDELLGTSDNVHGEQLSTDDLL